MEATADKASAPHTVQHSIMRAATIIMLGNILSRIVGYVRDITIATIYGDTSTVSGYLTALKVETSVYDLLVSGVISAAFIPVFSELRDRRDEFGRVASSILTATVVAMLVATLLIEALAVPLIAVLASGQASVNDTAVSALRLMAPAVLFLGVSGVLTALLYAKQRFVYPAFSPVVFNLGIVVAAIALHVPLAINALVVGVLVGASGQVVLQMNGLRGIRLWPLFEPSNTQVRRIGRLYVPVALGLVVTEAQVFLDLHLQNSTGPNSVNYLYYGTRIYQLPLGFVATAMSLASLPTLSLLRGRAFLETLARGLKVVTMLIMPAVVILAVLSTPIVALSFHHGNYSTEGVVNAVAGLQYYTPGLYFAAVDQLLIFAFYAKNDTKTPVVVGVISIGGYGLAAFLGLNVFHLGFKGLALADSVKQFTHAAILFALLWRLHNGLTGLGMGKLVVNVAAASLVCTIVCMVEAKLGADITHGLKLLVFVVVSCSVALAVYFGTLLALRTEEMALIVGRLQARLRHR
jgi:putative peptidoglycan lipid II flippase